MSRHDEQPLVGIRPMPPEARSEAVDHPSHYGGAGNPYEHYKVVEAWGLGYLLGNATKYICRAGRKTPDAITDLEKAKWYIQAQIDQLKAHEGS